MEREHADDVACNHSPVLDRAADRLLDSLGLSQAEQAAADQQGGASYYDEAPMAVLQYDASRESDPASHDYKAKQHDQGELPEYHDGGSL